jgi:hypothetical protein
MLSKLRASVRSVLATSLVLLALSSAGVTFLVAAPAAHADAGDRATAFLITPSLAVARAESQAEAAVIAAQGVVASRTDMAELAGRKHLAAEAVQRDAVFQSSVARIDDTLKQKMLQNGIWRPDAPVSLDQLRVITMNFWDFSGRVETGQLIVNQAWATQVTKVFKMMFDARFPIHRLDPVNQLRQTSTSALAYDNSEGFHARTVNGGWSMHAYGLAIDINPVENPWVRAGVATVPVCGGPYAGRPAGVTGLVTPNSIVVKAFKSIGWTWGGTWNSSKDYMHFSSNGH